MNTTISSAAEEINAFQHMLHPSAMRAYFAAHAPEVPGDYPYKKVLAVAEDGNGCMRETRRNEDPIARLVRWRVEYADQMIAALEAK